MKRRSFTAASVFARAVAALLVLGTVSSQAQPPPAVDGGADWEPTEEEQARIGATEAVLYGKVVDDRGEPVPGAVVVGLPNPDPWISGSRRIELKADARGAFVIREGNSPGLQVSTSAPGHYTGEKSSATFSFADIPASLPASLKGVVNPPSRTTPEAPAVFVLRRMGRREPLIVRSQSGVMRETREYLIGAADSHRIQVRYHGSVEGDAEGAWWVELAVPQGGIVLAEKTDMRRPASYVAPETGYAPTILFSKSNTDQVAAKNRNADQELFVRFADGTFARLETRFTDNPKRPFAVVRSWFNPSGSRSTEHDPSLDIETAPGE
ncbi:MAG: carboxypeptidase regulatory-like domain-containing protein [Verrucomicrobiaceae bacterium]|nr:MAG: carboxypeptidase regulatory-like domain-containing protein [Verrucomicrobiaceae bacterium]